MHTSMNCFVPLSSALHDLVRLKLPCIHVQTYIHVYTHECLNMDCVILSVHVHAHEYIYLCVWVYGCVHIFITHTQHPDFNLGLLHVDSPLLPFTPTFFISRIHSITSMFKPFPSPRKISRDEVNDNKNINHFSQSQAPGSGFGEPFQKS